jgi:hypothetical protein
MNNKILFISYFAGVNANCPAEWADDRLRAMESLDVTVIVITNYGSNLKSTDRLKIIRVPSLAKDDFFHELNLRRSQKAVCGFWIYLLIPLVFLFGRFFQVLTKLVTQGGSGGKWSWLVCALPVGLWIGFTKRIDAIYSTGGPPSAYFVGIVVSWLTRVPLKIEMQDPLVGAEINKSIYKQKMVRLVEKTLIKNANFCFYVTKKATEDSQKRNHAFKSKIVHNYPASWDFNISRLVVRDAVKRPVKILHLGTLYGSRNLDKFFMALDEIYLEKYINRGDIEITNLGSVYTSNATSYLERKDFNLLAETKRKEALEIAVKADFLLLVQHNDDRSLETIPYKIYDYINLNIPIIMLIKNHEIRDLCPYFTELVADCANNDQIKSAIRAAMMMFGTDEYEKNRVFQKENNALRINQQVENIILR